MPIAPNASYHYVMGGIKGNDLTDDQYARPLVGIRQKDFEDANEISTETDEGHTGISSINQGSYRTNAESAPTWEDKFRYGEFLEDIFYLLLGTVTKNTHKVNNTDMNGIFDYHFELPPNNSSELPLATLYNGYAKSTNDARVFNNALLTKEISFTFTSSLIISQYFFKSSCSFTIFDVLLIKTNTIIVKAYLNSRIY